MWVVSERILSEESRKLEMPHQHLTPLRREDRQRDLLQGYKAELEKIDRERSALLNRMYKEATARIGAESLDSIPSTGDQ